MPTHGETGAASAPPAPRTSLWAAASLISSLLFVPPLCIIAPLLGLAGLAQTRRGGVYRGRRLALAGVAIGLVTTAAWGGAAAWWHVNVRRPLLDGPREALVAGFGGDTRAFAAAFVAGGSGPSVAEAGTFIEEARQRYGSFVSIEQDHTAPPVPAGALDRRRPVIRYRVRFERATLPAEAQFVRARGAGLAVVLKWGYLIVYDAERGDLAYPLSAGTQAGDDAEPGDGEI